MFPTLLSSILGDYGTRKPEDDQLPPLLLNQQDRDALRAQTLRSIYGGGALPIQSSGPPATFANPTAPQQTVTMPPPPEMPQSAPGYQPAPPDLNGFMSPAQSGSQPATPVAPAPAPLQFAAAPAPSALKYFSGNQPVANTAEYAPTGGNWSAGTVDPGLNNPDEQARRSELASLNAFGMTPDQYNQWAAASAATPPAQTPFMRTFTNGNQSIGRNMSYTPGGDLQIAQGGAINGVPYATSQQGNQMLNDYAAKQGERETGVRGAPSLADLIVRLPAFPDDPTGTKRALAASQMQQSFADNASRLEAQRIEQQGKLDTENVRQKNELHGKSVDALTAMAGQAVQGIQDPTEKMQNFSDLMALGSAQMGLNNDMLKKAGLTVAGPAPGNASPQRYTPGGSLPAPAIPGVVQQPSSLEDLKAKLETKAKQQGNLKPFMDQVANVLSTPQLGPTGNVISRTPITEYTPDIANKLADAIASVNDPADKAKLIDEAIRQTGDKYKMGDAMVRAAAGNQSLLGLKNLQGGDYVPPSRIPFLSEGSDTTAQVGPDFPATLRANLSDFDFSRALNVVGGKPEANLNEAVVHNKTNRVVPIDQGDLFGIRNKVLATSVEKQKATLRSQAQKAYLEQLMQKGFYD